MIARHRLVRPDVLRDREWRSPAAVPAAITLPDRFRPVGVAVLLGTGGFCRVFLCDRRNHFVDVVDHDARPLFSFGGEGAAPGQFIDPCDVVIVPAADHAPYPVEHTILAVADRGNHRVQLFDAAGTLVALLRASHSREPHRPDGPPDIRTPPFSAPSRVRWEPPFLVISAANPREVRVDLGRSLLTSSRSSTTRSAIRGLLRQSLGDHPFGTGAPRHADGADRRTARRSPTTS